MKTQTLISVAVLCYNHEKLLPRTLKAFKEQTQKNYELILVDNDSTDKSYEKLLEFKKENPDMDIVVIHNTTKKVCEGRRVGFEAAHGVYIMFHDGDDWIENNCIQMYREILKQENYPDCIVGNTKSVDDDGIVHSIGIIAKESSVWMKNTLQAFLIKRELIEKGRYPFVDTFFEDFYVCMCIKPYIKTTAYLRMPLYNYYCNTNSASVNKNTKKVGFWMSPVTDLFEKLEPIISQINGQEEKTLAEYQLIRHYYSCVFAGGDYLSYKEKIISYKSLKKIIKTYFPRYLLNENVKLFAPNYYSGSFKKNIWLSIQLEKIDDFFRTDIFMKSLLGIYHGFLKLKWYKRKH